VYNCTFSLSSAYLCEPTSEYTSVDRRFIPLFMIVFIDLVGFGIVIPVLLLHAEESFGATDLQATGLLTAFSIGMVIAGPILGRLSDAYGRRPVLIVSQIGTFIGFIVLGLANSLFLLYLGRIIDGISGGNITTARAYINDITTEENRARGFGLISAAFGAGFIVGPALGGLAVTVTAGIPSLAAYSQNAPFFVAVFFSLASILGTYFILPESLDPEARQPLGERSKERDGDLGLLDVLKEEKMRTILSFTFVTFLAFSLFQSSFPIFARRRLFSDPFVRDGSTQYRPGAHLVWLDQRYHAKLLRRSACSSIRRAAPHRVRDLRPNNRFPWCSPHAECLCFRRVRRTVGDRQRRKSTFASIDHEPLCTSEAAWPGAGPIPIDQQPHACFRPHRCRLSAECGLPLPIIRERSSSANVRRCSTGDDRLLHELQNSEFGTPYTGSSSRRSLILQ